MAVVVSMTVSELSQQLHMAVAMKTSQSVHAHINYCLQHLGEKARQYHLDSHGKPVRCGNEEVVASTFITYCNLDIQATSSIKLEFF